MKKGGWTEEEDAILVEAQAKWGNCWTKIAKLLPGRSENAVKNRWNSATRRRANVSLGIEGSVSTRYLENLNDPDAMIFEGDTTASAVLYSARMAAAKIIAEENGKIAPEDDDPDTIKLSKEARTALMVKKRQLLEELHGTPSANSMMLEEYADELNNDVDSIIGGVMLPPVVVGGSGGGGGGESSGSPSDTGTSGEVGILRKNSVGGSSGSDKKEGGGKKSTAGRSIGANGKKKPSAADQLDSINGILMATDPNNAAGSAMNAGAIAATTNEESLKYLFFEDSNLTERERDLIHRAYLAGIASKAEATVRAANEVKRKTGARKKKPSAKMVGGILGHGSSQQQVMWQQQAQQGGGGGGGGGAGGLQRERECRLARW